VERRKEEGKGRGERRKGEGRGKEGGSSSYVKKEKQAPMKMGSISDFCPTVHSAVLPPLDEGA